MADGFIVRKGGAVTEQALAPTITEVSTTQTSITFTITNNDASTAVILYEIGDATPDENSIELATGVTSDSIEVTGLDIGTEYTVSATASVTNKVLSNVTSLAIETDDIVYTAATGGTTLEYDSGGKRYKSHTFTSDDDFIVTTVGDNIDDRNKVDFLVIAGGAGGGHSVDGGGGAGGYQTSVGTSGANSSALSKITVTAKTYGIDVGAGGVASTSLTFPGSGTNSVFDTITSVGGGRGSNRNVDSNRDGGTGGSGGGGTGVVTSPVGQGGSGTSLQGTSGGNGGGSTSNGGGGGGGGAGEAGANGVSGTGGKGGDGLANLLRTGSNETRAGGGGGGAGDASTKAGGAGGSGGGGQGGPSATVGTVNTGSGGGSGANDGGGGRAGGSGIVIIRYEIAPSV